MGVYDEGRNQIINALYAWDFTPAFPAGYAPPNGGDGVMIVPAWPADLLENLLQESPDGLMTMPVISVVTNYLYQWSRTLGDNFNVLPAYPLAVGTTIRKGARYELTYLTTVWTDAQLGAGETAEKIAGQVVGCMFYNKNRLSAIRNIRSQHSRLTYVDRPQLWRFDIWVDGDVVATYDTASNLYN